MVAATDENVAIDLDFGAVDVALTYDDNGNVTSDGLFDFEYDAWNRIVTVSFPDAAVTVAGFEYDGLNRRIRKTVTNWGTGIVMDSLIDTEGVQAGEREERYFYAGWRVVEERTGGGDVIAQTVWGTEYIDAPICRDRNTKFETTSCLDESSRRYFYHQDINFRVTALTDESGEIVERYDYDAYGAARIYSGGAVANSGEGGVLLAVSSVGNPYMHQGLRRDDETGTFENRMRCYNPRIGRFMQRDPAGYVDGMNLHEYVNSAAWSLIDPLGLCADEEVYFDYLVLMGYWPHTWKHARATFVTRTQVGTENIGLRHPLNPNHLPDWTDSLVDGVLFVLSFGGAVASLFVGAGSVTTTGHIKQTWEPHYTITVLLIYIEGVGWASHVLKVTVHWERVVGNADEIFLDDDPRVRVATDLLGLIKELIDSYIKARAR